MKTKNKLLTKTEANELALQSLLDRIKEVASEGEYRLYLTPGELPFQVLLDLQFLGYKVTPGEYYRKTGFFKEIPGKLTIISWE